MPLIHESIPILLNLCFFPLVVLIFDALLDVGVVSASLPLLRFASFQIVVEAACLEVVYSNL